jgi:acetoin utilization protein AcuB
VTNVAEYMTKTPHTIGVEQSLAFARRLMNDSHIRHLPVLRGGDLVGMLSQREVDALAALPGSSHLTVEEAMVPDVYVTPGDSSLAVVAEEMALRQIGSAIIVAGDENKKVLGVFTVVDALRALADTLRSPPATGA